MRQKTNRRKTAINWKDNRRETYSVFWNMNVIMAEGIQVPKFENGFWKREKIQVVYVAKKLAPVPIYCKCQMMQVVHNISGL